MHVTNQQSWQNRMQRLQKVLDDDLTMVYGISTDRYYAIRNAQERLIYWRNWNCDLPKSVSGGGCKLCEAAKETERAKAAYADYVEGYPDR